MLKTQKNFSQLKSLIIHPCSLANEPIASLVNEFSNYLLTKVKNIIDLLPSPFVPPPNTSPHSFISLTPDLIYWTTSHLRKYFLCTWSTPSFCKFKICTLLSTMQYRCNRPISIHWDCSFLYENGTYHTHYITT